MLDIDFGARRMLVSVEMPQEYPCALGWCSNTQFSGSEDGGHCLCDDCNRHKWILVASEEDFLNHQQEIGMSLLAYREFIQEHGGLCREGTADELNACIVRREMNLLIGMG